jgi:hypothetical protein
MEIITFAVPLSSAWEISYFKLKSDVAEFFWIRTRQVKAFGFHAFTNKFLRRETI